LSWFLRLLIVAVTAIIVVTAIIIVVVAFIKRKTYPRHLNHKTNCKCSKALQEITNQ
jgi:uncharacterized membrane protein